MKSDKRIIPPKKIQGYQPQDNQQNDQEISPPIAGTGEVTPEMLFQKGINWTDLVDKWKNGIFISKINDNWSIYDKCPIFTTEEGRTIIRNFLKSKDDK